MSKSRPLYGPLQFDETGRRHLVMFQTVAAVATVERFQGDEPRDVEVWVVDPTPAATSGRSLVGRRLTSQGAMFEALGARLQTETMGLRLYAAGDEAFLWDLFGLASRAGLGRDEVRLSRVGPASRRVYCTHCSTMSGNVATDLVVCRGCGLTLSVRDHFSRRLSAFMGVHADAEAPGSSPLPRALSA